MFKRCFVLMLSALMLFMGCTDMTDASPAHETTAAAAQTTQAVLSDTDTTAQPTEALTTEAVSETVTESVPEDVPPELRYVLHAGGVTPNGKSGSNSIEAIDHSYAQGYRVIELDFCWTEDGYLVCVHDWDAYYAQQFGKTCVTLDEFESVRHGTYGFTSLTLYELAAWMETHEDAVIVTDIKENSVDGARLIAEQYPHLQDRFYFQIYRKEDHASVYDLGFHNIILTVYQLSWHEKVDAQALAAYAEAHPLVGLTYPIELHEMYPDYTSTLLTSGTPLYVHTVNDAQVQKQLFAQGVFGVYTDYGRAEE